MFAAACMIESRRHRGWAPESMSLTSVSQLDIFLIGACRALSDGASQSPGRCACLPLQASFFSLAHIRPIVDPAAAAADNILVSHIATNASGDHFQHVGIALTMYT